MRIRPTDFWRERKHTSRKRYSNSRHRRFSAQGQCRKSRCRSSTLPLGRICRGPVKTGKVRGMELQHYQAHCLTMLFTTSMASADQRVLHPQARKDLRQAARIVPSLIAGTISQLHRSCLQQSGLSSGFFVLGESDERRRRQLSQLVVEKGMLLVLAL